MISGGSSAHARLTLPLYIAPVVFEASVAAVVVDAETMKRVTSRDGHGG
jgi:hypothetical protein